MCPSGVHVCVSVCGVVLCCMSPCVPMRVAPRHACHVAEIREAVGSYGPTVAAVAGRRGSSSLLEIDFARGRSSNSCDSLVRGVQSSQVVVVVVWGGVWGSSFQSDWLILL